MKYARENFDKIRKRINDDELFKQLYSNNVPREYKIIEEKGEEICIVQPFDYANDEVKWLNIWTKRKDWDIIESVVISKNIATQVTKQDLIMFAIEPYITSLNLSTPDDFIEKITILATEILLSPDQKLVYDLIDATGSTSREISKKLGIESKIVSSVLLQICKKTNLLIYIDGTHRQQRRYFKKIDYEKRN